MDWLHHVTELQRRLEFGLTSAVHVRVRTDPDAGRRVSKYFQGSLTLRERCLFQGLLLEGVDAWRRKRRALLVIDRALRCWIVARRGDEKTGTWGARLRPNRRSHAYRVSALYKGVAVRYRTSIPILPLTLAITLFNPLWWAVLVTCLLQDGLKFYPTAVTSPTTWAKC